MSRSKTLFKLTRQLKKLKITGQKRLPLNPPIKHDCNKFFFKTTKVLGASCRTGNVSKTYARRAARQRAKTLSGIKTLYNKI